MNATGLRSSDLGGYENATLLRSNLLEYRAFLKDEAAVEWLSGVAVKLATYTATGVIILLHVGGDMVNGLRLLILSARLMAIAHFEARRRVRDVRLAIVMSEPEAEAELVQTVHPDKHGKISGFGAHSRPSWLLGIILMVIAWCQVFVSILVAEYCSLAVETEINLKVRCVTWRVH